jgi:hypothetical protein
MNLISSKSFLSLWSIGRLLNYRRIFSFCLISNYLIATEYAVVFTFINFGLLFIVYSILISSKISNKASIIVRGDLEEV